MQPEWATGIQEYLQKGELEKNQSGGIEGENNSLWPPPTQVGVVFLPPLWCTCCHSICTKAGEITMVYAS